MHPRCLWRTLQTILHPDFITSGTPGTQKNTTTKKLQFIGSNESEHPLILAYYIILIFLSWFCSKTPSSDVSMWLSFEASPWKRSRGCGWSLCAAPELYFEEEATEPQIMLHSPPVWTVIIRIFTLILDKFHHPCFSLERKRNWKRSRP